MFLFEIVPLNESDLEDLREISIYTFTETFADANSESDLKLYLDEALSLKQLTLEFFDQDSEFFFLKLQMEIIGYLKLNKKKNALLSHSGSALEIERIYICKKFQGTGAGQMLLNHAFARAGQLNLHTVWLGVWEKNHKAIQFYLKNGFETFGSHPFLLGKDVQTDLLMKRELLNTSIASSD